MNKPLPEVDLSSAFAKPSRAAGIKLPPTKKAAKAPTAARQRPVSAVPDPEQPASALKAPQIDSEAPEPASTASQTPKESQSGRKAATRKAPTAKPAPPSENPGATRPAAGQGRLVLWTPVSIRARMQAVQAQQGTLYLDQVLNALEDSVDQLPDLVTKATSTPHVQGKLFERAVVSPPAETGSTPRVQLTIRGVLNSQLAVIDQLVESSGAPSRSALINAALDAVLPDLPDAD